MDISTVNNAVNQAFTSSNPGGVGTSYGQASGSLVSQAAADHPELASALSSGNVSLGFNADTGQSTLINSQTGQEIQGNYTVSSTPAGGVAINLPLSNGAMVQVASGVGQNGQIAPVTASNVYNVGLNAGAGGLTGGFTDLKPLLTQAALMYGGSQLSNLLGGGQSALDAGMGVYPTAGVNPELLGQASALDAGLNAYPSTGNVGNLSALDAGENVYPLTNVNPQINPAGATTLSNIGGATNAVTPATGLGSAATGLGTAATGTALGAGTGASTGATNALGLTPLQTAIGGTALAGLVGTNATNNAISNAANTQAQAGQNVQNTLGGLYSQYAQAQQPYQNLGTGAVAEIQKQAPYLTHQFNAADLQAGLAPNYDFMLQQGLRANQNAANVGGGLLSGNTLQGMQNYTQNYAQNAYQNAFNNYQTQRQNIYGNLSNAAGLGQTALGQLGQVGSNLAQTYGNVTTGLAASQAGAQTAQAVNNANLLSNLAKAGTVIALA